MGVGIDFACKTCKKSYYMGYGSYGLWIAPDGASTVEEWDAQPVNMRDVPRNRHYRDLLEDHSSHDWTHINWDFEYEDKKTGRLMMDGGYSPPTIIIEDYGSYERIDLEDVEPRTTRSQWFDEVLGRMVPLKK